MLDFALFASNAVLDRAVVHDSPILSVVTLAWIERDLTDLLVLPKGLQAFRSRGECGISSVVLRMRQPTELRTDE